MNKDVIYIDVEDDITAIISKVKASNEKIVALVPPKRVGILQSSVNLRLLARAANNANKRLVLITNSPSLAGLAATSKIPIAKNLQSKPEIAEIPVLAVDDGEDIIDGEQLPVGELARTADLPEDSAVQTMIPVKQFQTDEEQAVVGLGAAAVASNVVANKQPKKSTGPKVPDFNKFRKKLVIFGGLGLLLIGFLVWAIWFAPRANVIIVARTSEANVSGRATIGAGQSTDFKAQTIRSITQELKKDISLDFMATGSEERGEKATGTMTLTQSTESSYVDVPAGSSFSSGDLTFLTNEFIRVPGVSVVGGKIIASNVDVAVTASKIGSEFNLAARSYVSSIETITARGGQMSGGTKEVVKIVTADDVQQATAKLATQNNDAVKKELTQMFDSGVRVIESSFAVSPTAPQPSPIVGDVATDGKAKLNSKVTYTLVGLAKTELDNYLKQALQSQITNAAEQQVYDTGEKSAKLSEYLTGDSTNGSVAVVASGKIGPKIDEETVKKDAQGQEYGAIQQGLESIKGVDNVDIKFWPFWVRSAPNDITRISVEFKLESNDK